MIFIDSLHINEHEVLCKFIQERIRENREKLIGRAGHQIGNAQLCKGITDLVSQSHRILAQFKIQTVFKQRSKLDAQKSALGQHTAALIDQVAEVFLQRRIGNDN